MPGRETKEGGVGGLRLAQTPRRRVDQESTRLPFSLQGSRHRSPENQSRGSSSFVSYCRCHVSPRLSPSHADQRRFTHSFSPNWCAQIPKPKPMSLDPAITVATGAAVYAFMALGYGVYKRARTVGARGLGVRRRPTREVTASHRRCNTCRNLSRRPAPCLAPSLSSRSSLRRGAVWTSTISGEFRSDYSGITQPFNPELVYSGTIWCCLG